MAPTAPAPPQAPLDAYRAQFPVLQEQLYLNHAGVAPTSLRAVAAVGEWMEDLAHHGVRHERRWEERTEAVRAQAARLLNASPDEVAFVRNTSHGLGLVAEGLDWQPGDEVAVATRIEYPSNVYPWLHLASRGVRVREVEPSAQGGVDVAAVARALTPRTRLVAVSSVQFASGVQTDLEALGALCEREGVLLCVDGIQSVGCVPVDVKRSRIHFLSADSHKWMLGVSGVGLLYVDAAVLPRLRPVLVGWRSTTDAWNFNRAHFELRPDARKLEEGSAAYTGVYALGAALGLLEEVGMARVGARIRTLVDRLDAGLGALGCQVGPTPDARAGILTCVPPPHARGGAAQLAAHLSASGVSLSLRRERVRLSPHFYTREDEVDRVVALVRAFLG